MLRWTQKKRSVRKGGDDYATHSDFCAVFLQQLDRLYSLALILIGDERTAEECLLGALDFSKQQNPVFKESAVSWSRRNIIKTAIRSVSPAPLSTARYYFSGPRRDRNFDQHVWIKCVLELPDFERFVFVMSVLEGYSDRDCSLLLGCSGSDVVAARIRALQQISTKVTERHSGYGSGAESYGVDVDWLECG